MRFFDDHLLINSDTGYRLYNEFAKDQPIIDYHCHLNPADIWEDTVFTDIGQLWLAGDHYKWRAMRQQGIDEKYITGDADWEEKLAAYAGTLEKAVGNPLYYWSHMELGQLFDIHQPLNSKSMPDIRRLANDKMKDGSFSARKLMTRCKVEVVCTTDDPADDLEYHKKLQDSDFPVTVLPTFRPDRLCNGICGPDYRAYINRLSESAKIKITDLNSLLAALTNRLDYFERLGCKVADHGMTSLPKGGRVAAMANDTLIAALNGRLILDNEADNFEGFMLNWFARQYASRGWAMQLHLSPLRNVNRRLSDKTGPDAGVDTIGDAATAANLARILDDIACSEQGLPKMILYSLNPTANDMLAAMTGSFSGQMPGKMQLGSAWWFNDHADGITAQLRTLAAMGLLGNFVGMLTDSRSFTSYVRFDFFRRILCDQIGRWVERGEYEAGLAGQLIRDISYYNAKRYFEFKRKDRKI